MQELAEDSGKGITGVRVYQIQYQSNSALSINTDYIFPRTYWGNDRAPHKGRLTI